MRLVSAVPIPSNNVEEIEEETESGKIIDSKIIGRAPNDSEEASVGYLLFWLNLYLPS